MPELGVGGREVKEVRGATGPQYLADQVTLFQPGVGRLSPPITTGTPKNIQLPASVIPT